MPVAAAVWSATHNAITLAAIVVGKGPLPRLAETDPHVDPAAATEIRPLVGEAQMRLDDGAADRLQIEHAGIAGEIFSHPCAAARLDIRVRLGVHSPVVK